MNERLRSGLRRAIFGRRGCDPRLAARYRRVGAAAFAIGLGLPMLVGGLAAGAEPPVAVGVLAVSSIVGLPGGAALSRWIVPARGFQDR